MGIPKEWPEEGEAMGLRIINTLKIPVAQTVTVKVNKQRVLVAAS